MLSCLVVLGCAQSPVTPSGSASAPGAVDAGKPAAVSASAPPVDPVVPGAPPLVHFDPSLVDPQVDPCVGRFFLVHAFGWCNGVRPEIARTIVTTNPHSLRSTG